MSDRNQGYLLIILSAVFYSTLGILGKFIYNTGIEMSLVIVLRLFATVILLGLFLLITRKEPLLTFSRAVLFQGIFFVATAITFFLAVKYLSAGLATVILFTHPALVAVLAVIFYHEKIGAAQIAGLILALLGLFFISGLCIESSTALSPLGLILSVLSAVVYGIYALLGQRVVKTDGIWTITFTISLMGLVISALIFPYNLSALLSITPYQLFLGFAMAFLGTILPVVLFLKGVQKIGSLVGTLISIIEIPFALILAYLLLGEVLTSMQVVGTLLILIATTMAVTIKHQKENDGRN
ncbi:DMT family transporter [Desulfitobacterium chlororespirans]|uniref:Threonine/homoserine efflux transporter RhtA n=1 Tax=Desulfitobacterium chlororespirans DSM 11544 TaxID=1121395 RepID=A0A1M7RTD2_9FIRM|nr:DMT family transporter [Desulfitobacterium chlororespirans]SHN49481.1 Threonine/homoserine efflux transporter RhtA [Desulfitobacterium chlororespirans DSM 11544]